MFHFFPIHIVSEIISTNPNYTIIIIDNSIVGKRGIIDYIEKAINSPYECDNWDGFEEAIDDLCWLEDPHIKIIHLDLPSLSEMEMAIYLKILNDSYIFWSMAPSLDVEVIFIDTLRSTVESYLSKSCK